MDEIGTVNEKGVITLPRAMREKIGLLKGGSVQIRVSAEGILLVPVAIFPVEIYTEQRIADFNREEEELKKFKF